jgi:hypothetical protein
LLGRSRNECGRPLLAQLLCDAQIVARSGQQIR